MMDLPVPYFLVGSVQRPQYMGMDVLKEEVEENRKSL